MAQDLACLFPSLAVSARLANELSSLDAPRYDRFCAALNAADRALREHLEDLPLDDQFIFSAFEVSLLIRFHDLQGRFYVCAYLFETDIEPDPRDPPPAGLMLPHDWISDTVLVDGAAGLRTIELQPRRQKILMSAGHSAISLQSLPCSAMLGETGQKLIAEPKGISYVSRRVVTEPWPAKSGGSLVSIGLLNHSTPNGAYCEPRQKSDNEPLTELELFPAMLAVRPTGIVRNGACEGSVERGYCS